MNPPRNSPENTENTNTAVRSVDLNVVREDGQAAVRATISTETPVLELVSYNGELQRAYRVLDHGNGMDISRVADGMPVTEGHFGEQVGLAPVEKRDGKLVTDGIQWGASQRAQDIRADAENKIRRNLSIEAAVDETSYELDGEQDGIPILRVMRWTPLAVAFVTQQADLSAGIGRTHQTGGKTMDKNTPNPEPTTPSPEPKTEPNAELERARARTQDVQRIYELARFHDIDPETTREAVESGKSLGEFQEQVMKAIRENGPTEPPATHVAPEVGMSDKEVKQYSILRALRMQDPSDPLARENTLEREVSAEVGRLYGRDAQGVYIPAEVCARDLTTAGSGGNLVDTDLMAGSMIEMLRSNLTLTRLGVQTLGGLTGDVSIPKQTASSTGYWVSEGNAPTESQQTLQQLGGRPHTAGAITDISRRMLKQSSLDVEAFVQRDLAATLARLLQTAAIAGTGSDGQPKGLIYADGVNSPTISSANSPTWKEIVNAVGMIMADNISPENAGWLLRPLVWACLAGTPKAANSAVSIADTASQTVAGYNYEISTGGIPAKSAIFGVWSELMLLMWGAMDVVADPYKHSDTGALRVVLLQDTDVVVRHGEAFSYVEDVIS